MVMTSPTSVIIGESLLITCLNYICTYIACDHPLESDPAPFLTYMHSYGYIAVIPIFGITAIPLIMNNDEWLFRVGYAPPVLEG